MNLENLILFEIDWVIISWIEGAKFFLRKNLLDFNYPNTFNLTEQKNFFGKQSDYSRSNFEMGFQKLKSILDEKKNNATNCCILTSQHPFDTTFAYEIGKRTGINVDYIESKKFYEETEEILKSYSIQTLVMVGASFGLQEILHKITLGMTIVNLEKDPRMALLISVLRYNKLTVEHFCPLVIDFKGKVVYPYLKEYL